ncbi:MAG: hypothetical protein CVU46_15030 [Chloroflexi bacterium HGW-Chloroflexi-8]|nr:MAG: hypothetical protein CVU46_15030 [Chloroflexi bacterium HGW-Chloroflexi-8]
MTDVQRLDLSSKKEKNEFVMFPFTLYKDVEQWVPPFISDMKMMLDTKKHPFYEHSIAEYYVAKKNDVIVGRLGVMENKPFNKVHETKKAQFYFFDSIDDQEVANSLFERGFEWCRKHDLDTVIGPKGLSAFDGYGIQIEGFENRQMMTMMNYNFPYYQKLVETVGFEKEVDFVSCYINSAKFVLPEKAQLVVQRVREKGKFKVITFQSKKELKKWAKRIGVAYNKTFINNWEYYPFSDREVQYIVDQLMIVADPKLIKIITYNDDVIGFLLAFPDISEALQRQKGRITPWGVLDIMLEFKRTKWVSLNGAGVLPEYHGSGGNVLLYDEMAKSFKDYDQYIHGELTQVAETAVQMRKDLISMGGRAYKNHRVFRIKI